VLNNQIGFTTLPKDARSTRYATDIARMLMIPVFHVHGEDPEAVANVARLASDYRQQFGRDVVVEIICYRRHGHNEGDEPYFTQPLMYAQIQGRPPVHRIYSERLVADGIPGERLTSIEHEMTERLENAASTPPDTMADIGFSGDWGRVARQYEPVNPDTGVDRETMISLSEQLTKIPPGFTLHKKIEALLNRRHDAVNTGSHIDWGCAEALAFASILREGTSVRVSGQDSRRGTFNHRHAVLHDMTTGTQFTPLASIATNNSQFRIYDSLLSEYAALGFEYGYAAASPDDLVVWEAQFGDFANGAQVIIDQFIASGESKWDRSCGVVLLLPHGYEGNGAEHSSARIERWLSLCAEDNLLITYPSTPAQFFHLLRRQVRLPFRKPLVVFTPKGLLRHPDSVSELDELVSGTFREVIAEETDGRTIRSVIFCSGKIYYELAAYRKAKGRNDVAIVRIEQFYPLRIDLLNKAVGKFPESSDWCWVQEEPLNMGGGNYILPYLAAATGRHLRVVSRPAAAAPAVGSHRLHGIEQEKVLTQAFQEGNDHGYSYS
jgi:2-oxoglutarate dehydrogenase E1 component